MGRWLFKPWLIITCCLVRGKEGGGRRKGNTQDGLLGIRASATGWKVGRNRGLNPILSFQNFYVIIQPQGATYSLTQLLQVQFKKPLNKSVTRDVYTYPSFLRRQEPRYVQRFLPAQERRVKALVFNDLFKVSFKLLPDRIVSEFEVPAFARMTDSPDSPGRRPHHTPNLRFRCTPPALLNQ